MGQKEQGMGARDVSVRFVGFVGNTRHRQIKKQRERKKKKRGQREQQ